MLLIWRDLSSAIWVQIMPLGLPVSFLFTFFTLGLFIAACWHGTGCFCTWGINWVRVHFICNRIVHLCCTLGTLWLLVWTGTFLILDNISRSDPESQPPTTTPAFPPDCSVFLQHSKIMTKCLFPLTFAHYSKSFGAVYVLYISILPVHRPCYIKFTWRASLWWHLHAHTSTWMAGRDIWEHNYWHRFPQNSNSDNSKNCYQTAKTVLQKKTQKSEVFLGSGGMGIFTIYLQLWYIFMEIMVPLCLVRKADAGETVVPQH